MSLSHFVSPIHPEANLSLRLFGPSSKVRAIIGFDGSTVEEAVSAGAPASFAVIDALMPSTLSPAPSVPAVAPFTAQSVQERLVSYSQIIGSCRRTGQFHGNGFQRLFC